MNSLRSSRYKFITFLVAAISGMLVADLFVPNPGSAANLLLAGGVAAVVAILMVWIGPRKKDDGEPPPQ